ncbi:MAG: hypothetical protein FI729_01790 [SAR202 cluster bacterium]|jgi:ATP-dependent protease ClpP protease subunit|nr:hypothetical protein [SAR202 cluster bacterium]|tara:strand:+ start:4263 stop:4907 length:645 start_codon:yes stop_codon:yes gene_type:complete
MSDQSGDIHSYGLDVKNREVYLHGYHGSFDEDPGVEYRMATNFIKNIRLIDTAGKDPILIHMHSIGGNWNDGMAIYDAIKACTSYTTILVYGQAESMSGIVLQAADKRVMMPNAYFMCHFGSSGYEGHYLNVRSGVKFEEKLISDMLDIYTSRCKSGKFFKEHYNPTNESKVKNYINTKMKSGDWYLNSHESVYYGFADSVLMTRKNRNISSLK